MKHIENMQFMTTCLGYCSFCLVSQGALCYTAELLVDEFVHATILQNAIDLKRCNAHIEISEVAEVEIPHTRSENLSDCLYTMTRLIAFFCYFIDR